MKQTPTQKFINEFAHALITEAMKTGSIVKRTYTAREWWGDVEDVANALGSVDCADWVIVGEAGHFLADSYNIGDPIGWVDVKLKTSDPAEVLLQETW